LARVRQGQTVCLDQDSVGCPGGRRYLGFSDSIRPGFEYFLSCGIPGKMEGERYKSSPQTVLDTMANLRFFQAPAKYIVFKRWDKLDEKEQPEIVIFFARPDVLSGLFTLSNFDETDPNACLAPFGAGCASVVQYPYLERQRDRPRSVLGMFDVSARPCVPANTLSLATAMSKFTRMVENMESSFLTTASWAKVQKRINASRTTENQKV
jgi:hypothetical protein